MRNIKLLGWFGPLLAATVLLGFSRPVSADTLIVGYPTQVAGVDYFPVPAGLPPNQAVQFTLSSGFYVSHIDLGLVDESTLGTIFDFTIQDSLTNPTNVFFSGKTTAAIDSLTVNSFLSAGTYYLVTATEAGGAQVGVGWQVSNGTEVSNGGTSPNIAYALDTTNNVWLSLPGSVTAYAVYGTPVPEPSSLLLLGASLLALGPLLRQRIRAV